MWLWQLGLVPLTFFIGCSLSPVPRPKATNELSTTQPIMKDRNANDPPKKSVTTNKNALKDVIRTDGREPFDDNNMVRPVIEIRGYTIDDYRKLPNCLTVFKECVAVPFEGKTSEQYKDSVLQIAQRPCRIVLKLVEVPADYDYAEFELLTDDGESALAELKQGGDLSSYTRHFKTTFAINNIKKRKGLNTKRLSIGDRIELVGLGYVVNASSYGASSPTYGMPKGDERYVMLRAFGKPNRYHKSEYEFSFMVRNWYVASQQ